MKSLQHNQPLRYSKLTPISEKFVNTRDHIAKATVELVSGEMQKMQVLWDIFSGTGFVGQVFESIFERNMYSIDIDAKAANRSNGECADVRNFDFSN